MSVFESVRLRKPLSDLLEYLAVAFYLLIYLQHLHLLGGALTPPTQTPIFRVWVHGASEGFKYHVSEGSI